MNRLTTELQRLYDQPELVPRERGSDGTVRVAVVEFARAADWNLAARLYQEVQAALELPSPAVSILGGGGYQLWFSFSEPVSVDLASSFLLRLCGTYLGELPPGQFGFWPDDRGSQPAALRELIFPPAQDEASGKWSAFIDPDLGSMFVDEPGLEMAPSDERQADLLAGIASIRREVFARALARLAPPSVAVTPVAPEAATGATFADPRTFLLAVMNDPAASLDHRIEAAKALLPWFER